MTKKRNKILLIGWDAADWKVINPLIDAGKMPALESMINKGVMGDIATLEPVLSPMLWSSIGTGKLADKHGVLGFTEPDMLTGSVKPISVTSRKVKAIWNILTQNGYKTNLVGWWPSHPAEPINGVNVSNHYQRANKPFDQPWEMLSGTIHPETYIDKLAELRIHPQELTEAHILPFIPNAANIDQEKDKRIVSFSKILADTATVQSCATYLMDNTEWDFMGVYFDGIDHFSHGFMKYHPPKLPSINQKDFDMYKDVVNGAYIFHDMMLESMLSMVDDETTVILISDHGFHSDHLRPEALPKEAAAPAYEHRKYGIFCAKGPNIKKDELVHGANLLDITPTILNICGLPIGEDMDGKVLSQIFKTPNPIETIKSWEEIDGYCGMHPKDMQEDPMEAKAALDQMVELGYIERPSDNGEVAQKRCVKELQYNLARVYISTKRYKEAIQVLEKLIEDFPNETRFLLRLAQSYQEIKDYDKAHEYISKTRKATIENYKKKQEEVEEKTKNPPTEQKNKPKIDYNALLKKMEQNKPDKLPSLDLLEASILINQNKPKKALEILESLIVLPNLLPQKSLYVGRCFLLLKKWENAETEFRKVLSIDRDDIGANHGLAICLLKQKKYHESIEASLDTIALSYNFAVAHYHLGEALLAIKDYQNAANAFNVCLKLNPHIGKARNFLIEIYNNHPEIAELETLITKKKNFNTSSKELIAEHKTLIKEQALGEIIAVSGLPRSGTSMMMQMLVAGGMDAFTDKKRKPDESNPKGYFEHEAIKKLNRDSRVLKEVGNKVVKIISHLLINLPSRYTYKVIFMTRELEEVLASQHIMLEKNKKIKPKTYAVSLKNSFLKNLNRVKVWAKKNYNVEILYVNYTDVLNNPKTEIARIKNFLDKNLDEKQMIQVVDKSLYRNKLKKTNNK